MTATACTCIADIRGLIRRSIKVRDWRSKKLS